MTTTARSAPRNRRAALWVCALLVVSGLAAMWWLPRGAAPQAGADANRVSPSLPAAATSPAISTAAPVDDVAHAATRTTPDALASLRSRWQRSSLRGSELDGAIRFDAEGGLLLGPELRHRFEHYLALIGEFSLDELKALLLDDVLAEHGASAMAKVQSAFERYLGLRQASSSLAPELSLTDRHAALQALRRQWFGEDAAALFGDEADYDSYTLERMRLAALPVDQRESALAELAARRPTAETEARTQSQSAQLAEEQTRQFDALGLDAAARAAEREALWGSEAAERLAALDQERAAWEQRLQAYAEQRARLLADPRLTQEARREALETLLAERFNGTERRRVEGLQQAGLLPASG